MQKGKSAVPRTFRQGSLFDLLPGKGILWKERDTMHPAKEIHMVKRHLRLLVVTVACIALLGGCASKYGAQTTQVNYYPQCYSPVAQLRADEDRITNSTAGGAAGGALLGALIGGLATGKVEGALAGAVAGGAAGAVGGNIYGKSQQRENDRRLLASYAAQLDEDSAGMDRATAAARLSARCYDEQFKKAAAQYKAGAITRQDFQDRYMEIRSGLEETSRILKLTSDHVIERDAEYQKTLAQAQAKGQVSQRQQAPRKEKKAWNNSRRELESTRQDVDMRLATYEQTVNNLML